MKVEPARSEKSDTNNPGTKTGNVQLQPAGAATAKAAEGANQGAFSKFLDAARETDESDRNKKPADADSESSVDDAGDGKKETPVKAKNIQRDDQNDSSSDHDGGDNNPGWAAAPVPAADALPDTKAAVPQARAILHVADLERIVSAVRSDSFAGSKQVTIDLKNSVLDGLRIQLTMTEQGNLKAEFLALNEQVKKQLDARKIELESVLKDRSIKCRELKVTVIEPDVESVLKVDGYEESKGR
ncbi:MAG: hypothetical protein HOP17_05025 [Acidobacteria bacterium]|nr:hypothetical protein [Acidobacteriota bacterium]